MKSHFHLHGPHHIIYFHIHRPWKERSKLAEAGLGLKACIAKGEGGIATQEHKVMKGQRPYLRYDLLVIHVRLPYQLETNNRRVGLRCAECRLTLPGAMFFFQLKRSFATLTRSNFLTLYKTFIHPHLEYAIQASSPILLRDFQAAESVHKLALTIVKGLRRVQY